jgi:beta-lactamase class A
MTAGLTGLGTRRRRRRLPYVPLISALLLVTAISLFVIELLTFSQQQTRLPTDTSVAGVPVGGLAPGEARVRWEQAFAEPLTLWYGSSPILLDPSAIGFRVNSDVMLAQALSAGDVQAGFWSRFLNYMTNRELQQSANVPLAAEYQEQSVEQFLQNVAARYDRPSGDIGYDLQTLTLRPGAEGAELDVQAAIPLIDVALRDPERRSVNLPIGTSGVNSARIDTLRDMIVGYLDSQGFIYDGQTTVASVFILDLQTGEEVNLLGDVAVSAASTAKVAILIDYFRHLSFAPTPDEAWLLANSLLCSNNASSNLLMEIIGERASGNRDLFVGLEDVVENTQYVGATNTYLTAPFDLGIEGQELGSIPAPATSPNPNFNTFPDPYNQTTTEDLGTLFSMIYDCANYGSGLIAAYPNGEFTQTECRQMLELMSANDLLRLLQGGIPDGVRISHKNGWIANTHGDAGIVFPPNGRNYVIAVFLWENTDFADYNRIWPLVEGISRATWNYFSPEDPLLAPRTDIPLAAQECEGNYLPPDPESTDLNNINGWRNP